MSGVGLGTYIPPVPSWMASTTPIQRALWSHTRLLNPLYTGPLCRLWNGTALKDFYPNRKGILDSAAVIKWAGGNLIRIDTIYNQGTQSNLVQSTDANRHVLDPTNINPEDGLWPYSSNASNAQSTSNSNTFMTFDTSTTSNGANHTVALVVEVTSNVGGSQSSANNTLLAITQGTAAARTQLQLGDSSFSSNIGLGVSWGTTPTKSFPTPPLIVPCNRSVIMMTASTATSPVNNNIDGHVVGTGGSCIVSLQVNEDKRTFMTTNTSNAATSGKVGQASSGTSTGASHLCYAIVMFANSLVSSVVTAGDTDERNIVKNALYNMFNINPYYDNQLLVLGSSSMAGYRSNSNGFPIKIERAMGGNPRVDVFARAGTDQSVIYAGINNFASLRDKQRYLRGVAFLYNVRNDLDGGLTANTVWTNSVLPSIQALKAADWDVIIGTQVKTVAGSASQATLDSELAAFNNLVINNASTYGYTVADTYNLPQFSDYNNTTYYDTDKIHLNATGGTVFANFVSPIINSRLMR